MNRALEMDREVVKFLVEHGGLPAFKDIEDKTESAIEALYNKFRGLQAGLESAFIQELRNQGKLPQDEDSRQSLIQKILAAPLEKLRAAIADGNVQGAELGREDTFTEVQNLGMAVNFTSFSDKVVEDIRNKAYLFSENTINTITGNFRNTLQQSYEDGIGIDDAATRLQSDFSSLRHGHLSTIARTEIQSSQNLGTNQTMRDIGVQYKQWITARDPRVRGYDPEDEYDHVTLHGEVVNQDGRFTNGLEHPGDKSGAPGQTINCRCRIRPYIPGEGENILSTPYYP